ncbi:MAG TPA: antitoxin [Trebonia sp.]|jgi:hypothetical protein|nr:antitoxin [Trebonia sp.]
MDFGELVDKAKQVAGEHPDQVHEGVEKAEDFVEQKSGGQFGDRIEQAGGLVEGFLGVQEADQQHGSDQQ